MRTVLVTGSGGFIGRNLIAHLAELPGIQVLRFDVHTDPSELSSLIEATDFVYHLAGVNRPDSDEEFVKGNVELTKTVVNLLQRRPEKSRLVLSSSTQAVLENPYGKSKRAAEEVVVAYGAAGGNAAIYRLTNVFGKWSRPNYNSVVATFCHNIARGQEITVSDPSGEIELVYIDDVIEAFLSELKVPPTPGTEFKRIVGANRISLMDLAREIREFRNMRSTGFIPDVSDRFRRALLATYQSFLPKDQFAYPLETHQDQRGILAELIKSEKLGQIFVSRTKPGVTRGNHYHHSKVEKFCVIEGDGIIRFREIDGGDLLEYGARGTELKVVDIPPGYTHSIENLGSTDMIVLFWSAEVFDKSRPDTHFLPVVMP